MPLSMPMSVPMPPFPSIRRAEASAEYDTVERCAILELSNDPGDPQVSIARARVAPGVTTAWHRLVGTTERYLVLSGRGRVELGDASPAELGPGDVAVIPAMCRQRITNVGATDLVFLAICSPRFVPECYESLEPVPADGIDPAAGAGSAGSAGSAGC